MTATLDAKFLSEANKIIEANKDKLDYNERIFDILEGDLMSELVKSLKIQLSDGASSIAIQRAAPINVLKKIISKLSRLYTEPPKRETSNPVNQELINEYSAKGVNQSFQAANEAVNSYKWTTLELYFDTDSQLLKSRVVPSHMFVPFGLDPVEPLRVTGIIKMMGSIKDDSGVEKNRFWIYTDDQFFSIDQNGALIKEDMTDEFGEVDSVNQYGVNPFEYISTSNYLLVPKPDTDTLQMTLLLPVLLTDMNFGSMFLAMPILYGIDVDASNMKMSPNHFWNLASTINENGQPSKPEVGVIRAEPDLNAMMESAINQLSLWLDSRNIKPGTIGKLTAENFASGVSKIISEMDTVEFRKSQMPIFKKSEQSFWIRLAKMHNRLVEAGLISNKPMFVDPDNMVVNVTYPELPILQSREEKIRELKSEVDAGFTSRRRAIRSLNPDAEDGFEDDLMLEIDNERTVYIDASQTSENND